jgi:hypothetical protein
MATTKAKQSVGPITHSAKYEVTADNDVIFAAGERLMVIGAMFEGLATALNIDSGADITAYPFTLEADEELNVTASGAGTVELVFAIPVVQTYSAVGT